MKDIFLIHWEERELRNFVRPLQDVGYQVTGHWSKLEPAKLKESLPDVLVISLEKRVGHGRHVAEWMWDAKKRRHVPILFVGGPEEKVNYIKNFFPRAYFSSVEDMIPTVNQVFQELEAAQAAVVETATPAS